MVQNTLNSCLLLFFSFSSPKLINTIFLTFFYNMYYI